MGIIICIKCRFRASGRSDLFMHRMGTPSECARHAR